MYNKKIPKLSATICLICLALGVFANPAVGWPQDKNNKKEKAADPEVVNLVTSDFVKLQCTFYPGSNAKETIPIVLLHRWDESDAREAMFPLAGYLQSNFGHAVIIPDLRGHGKSIDVVNSDETLNKDRWRATEMAAVVEDIEACKKFLVKKNNEGELNIDLLTVIAEGESNIQAVAWTMRDWSYGELGGVKQGRDVKALVMIDPVRSFKGLNCNDALKSPLFSGRGLDPLPVLVSAESKKSKDASTIANNLKRARKSKDLKDPLVDFFKYRVKQNRKVIRINRNEYQDLAGVIGDFINNRVNSRKHDFRWQDRSQ